ncbi:hypothetical protein BC835DRAFT_1418738 [Cytidiella melzeri]|nr:hypothetical protein BC835DRAFT_1418738 [Cytidiella melzeri]
MTRGRLGKSGTSLGLSRVLPKVFLSAISGEMPNNALSTHSFLRTCRKVSGIDPRSFAEQWIYGSGCPTFGFSASFNRKKMAVEIQMKQEAPAYQYHENSESMKLLYKPVPFFEGQMTIRIHEADGTPYQHVLDIRSPFKRYEVPFNTKYKRVRRNTKRYLARQAAAQAAAEGDAEAAAAMDMIDMGFGLEIWEKEKERENWKFADWTEEDEQNMSGQTYEWIANISFDQKDYTWVSQLQRDRDVVAQYEAITVLKKTSQTAVISSTFTKTVLVTNYSFRIRCEAAQALVAVVDYPHITEPVLRESKAGLAAGKLRSHASKQVADQAKDLVKKWKQTVEQAKLQNGKGSASSGASKPQVPVSRSFHTYHTQRLDTGDVSPQTVGREKLKERWPSSTYPYSPTSEHRSLPTATYQSHSRSQSQTKAEPMTPPLPAYQSQYPVKSEPIDSQLPSTYSPGSGAQHVGLSVAICDEHLEPYPIDVSKPGCRQRTWVCITVATPLSYGSATQPLVLRTHHTMVKIIRQWLSSRLPSISTIRVI